MITGDFKECKDLSEFYLTIKLLHEKSHGKYYTAVHDEIQKLANGNRYIELGVNQGATLAAANLCKDGLQSCMAYDISINRVEPYTHLFIEHANWPIDIKAGDSIVAENVKECDVLYIDTKHTSSHLTKELNLWHKHVKKNIICHDTKAKPNLLATIRKFVDANTQWKIININTKSVGFTTLERV